MTDEKQFVLGIAYQSGPDPRIRKGADGHRDYFSDEELELAAWGFMGKQIVGLFHADGTEGHATVVESYLYRGPDWAITDVLGNELIVKSGDWLVGAVLDDIAWSLFKEGKITGWSPQGAARRRSPVTKSVLITYPADASAAEIGALLTTSLEGAQP
jgi:hypothetical protein